MAATNGATPIIRRCDLDTGAARTVHLPGMKLPRTVLRRLLALLVVAALALYQYYGAVPDAPPAQSTSTPDSQATQSSAAWRAGQWVELTGTVQRLLSDDNEGSRHQRFILRLAQQERTLLIAHNIDLAERVPLRRGDNVRLRGRYESNDRGGVIHWTHHDPQGFNSGGWIEYRGIRYQ
jgi:hypothetical protein